MLVIYSTSSTEFNNFRNDLCSRRSKWKRSDALLLHFVYTFVVYRVPRSAKYNEKNTIEWIIDRSYAMFLEATQVELVAGVAAV